jgi:hypothetical protein
VRPDGRLADLYLVEHNAGPRGMPQHLKMIETSAAAGGFVHDLKASLSACRKAPLLPVLTALLAAFPEPARRTLVGDWAQAITFGLGLLSVGWLGTQLIWYQRVFEGEGLHARELIPVTVRFILRYFLLFALLLIPAATLAVLLSLFVRLRADSFQSPVGRVSLIVVIVAIQVVGTFIIPALAYSTSKVRKAIPIGLRMLADGWPENWRYVVMPAVFTGAIAGVSWLMPLGQTGWAIIGALGSLVFWGAVARYYLRSRLADGHVPLIQPALEP